MLSHEMELSLRSSHVRKQNEVLIVSELPRFAREGDTPTPLVGPTTLQILARPLPILLSELFKSLIHDRILISSELYDINRGGGLGVRELIRRKLIRSHLQGLYIYKSLCLDLIIELYLRRSQESYMPARLRLE